jgi:uncharacterized protein (DUF58 family)
MRGVWRGLRRRAESYARPRARESLPVVLDRSRVYVLPTRFGLFFAALVVTMGLGALNYNNNPALLLALLLAGAGHASLLAAHLQLSGLGFTALGAEPVPAGTPLQLRLHVRAKPGRERRGLQIRHDDATTTLSLEDGVGVGEIALPTTRRGWTEVPRLRVQTTRPLGVVVAWGYVWPEQPLLVYPAPEPQGPPLPEGQGEAAQTRLHLSGDDVHHLRAYRRGDSRRAIAWKPSARRDSLLVREYEEPLGADLALDWNSLGGVPYETRISRLARWVDEAERDGRRYRLVLPGHATIGPAQGPAHRHACLRALALLPHVQA